MPRKARGCTFTGRPRSARGGSRRRSKLGSLRHTGAYGWVKGLAQPHTPQRDKLTCSAKSESHCYPLTAIGMNDQYLSLYDDVAGLERYLEFPPGTLRQLPIYARRPAVDAILKVREMERSSLFRPGLYYIVLADLVGSTAFNEKYGDAEGDVRTQWFQTCVIESLGGLQLQNYVAFNKTIGDASLLMFSSIKDVYNWSLALTDNLASMTYEYPESLEIRGVAYDPSSIDQRLEDFAMQARRLVHLGEVSYKDHSDPLCLAVSQTFKIEKNFTEMGLGCTQPVADAIRPKLGELGAKLVDNKEIRIAGSSSDTMSYYVIPASATSESSQPAEASVAANRAARPPS